MRKALVALILVLAACGSINPTPAPGGSALDIPQLKFAVLDAVGRPVYCDPDFYPIAREGGEQANAIALYSQIKADAPAYAAIVAHEYLPSGELTDAQKLVLYRAWKLLRVVGLSALGSDYAFGYVVEPSNGSWLMVKGTVRSDGVVMVMSRTPSRPPLCPICLAASTLIATPSGDVLVTKVRVGMVVWTQDAAGRRVAEPVVQVGSMTVPPEHLMVHVVLADGRSLLVSPGHPTADGRTAGALRVGDVLDGSPITLWQLVPYGADRTYDLLPAGASGHYWANGILMGSTLV